MISLKNHPFAVEAFFERSLVLTFAVPKDELSETIPPCLELDVYDEQWAFIAVAMVQTKNLKPKGFPKIFANDFFLIGYRIFVKYRDNRGRTLRGLYILKSETDSKRMEFLGNIFAKYSYTTTDIQSIHSDQQETIFSDKSKFSISIAHTDTEIPLPTGSVFKSWKEARRYAGPLPFTFSFDAAKKEVLIIEGVRKDWNPIPIAVVKHQLDFLEKLSLSQYQLANAFAIYNIPYYWKKGRIEKWK